MAVNVKWNTSDISALIHQLENNFQVLSDNEDFLININSEIENAWQGYAGRAFDKRMDIDAENLRNVTDVVNKLIEDLKKVEKNCYEQCEENIQQKISSLKSKI